MIFVVKVCVEWVPPVLHGYFQIWLTLTLYLFGSMHLQAAMAEQINLSLLCPLSLYSYYLA